MSARLPPKRSAREISLSSASSKWRRFGSSVSPSVFAWRSTRRCRRAFSSAIDAWEPSQWASSRASSLKSASRGVR